VNRLFKGICRLHLQGRKVNQAINKLDAGKKYSLVFLLGLYFYPEVGGDMFFRNVGRFSSDYKLLITTEANTSNPTKSSGWF
jgi:hypothetical protein